jgi:hypothetical protein
MALWTYSPVDVDIYIAGAFKMEGFIDGTFVQVKKASDQYSFRESTDGVVTRTAINSHTYNVTITLAQSSPTNSLLTKIVEIDELTHLGIFPIIIKDRSGSSFFFSPSVWINKTPELTFGTELESRTWELIASYGSMNVGDNTGDQSDFESLFTIISAAAPAFTQLFK